MFIVERVIGTLAPHECLRCGYEGSLLCSQCLPGALVTVKELFYRCRQPSFGSAVCSNCRQFSDLSYVWVRTEYKDLAKQLVYNFKFDRAQSAVKPIAELMDLALPWMPSSVIVVHIPTATSRRRQRGYDQAQLLAKAMAKKHKLQYVPLLARVGQSRQLGATRSERLKQLDGAFRPIKDSMIKGANILLVDDILTTGGTLEEAARVLKRAGAKRVNALVFARK